MDYYSKKDSLTTRLSAGIASCQQTYGQRIKLKNWGSNNRQRVIKNATKIKSELKYYLKLNIPSKI